MIAGHQGAFLLQRVLVLCTVSFYMRKTRGAKSALRVFDFIFAF